MDPKVSHWIEVPLYSFINLGRIDLPSGKTDLLPFQATTRSCFCLAGELRTLGDLLHEFVPEAFTSGSGAIDNEWRVVIHGIEPPLETPAQWISEHFSHPDNFLYIVLVRVV